MCFVVRRGKAVVCLAFECVWEWGGTYAKTGHEDHEFAFESCGDGWGLWWWMSGSSEECHLPAFDIAHGC